jgi:hypothetical protein
MLFAWGWPQEVIFLLVLSFVVGITDMNHVLPVD